MYLARSESMKILAEKMRHLGHGLKCVGDVIRQRSIAIAAGAKQLLRRIWLAVIRILQRIGVNISPAPVDYLSMAGTDAANIDFSRPAPLQSGWRRDYPRLAKALYVGTRALLIFLALPYIFILLYRIFDPPFSALMVGNALTGNGIRQEWRDVEDISPNLVRAVILAEDSAFCRHWGVDWHAVGTVLEELEIGEKPRGASTIPMQTAKNMFLWQVPGYFRKVLEVPQAYFMTLIWPKSRVIEIYLNFAEWGPGIFGAEAAARHHFGKSASQLTSREAALMAASLPNPIRRRAGKPGPQTSRLATRLQGRMGREAHDAACIFK